jgi:methyl-accepting chemotaxis protein
MGEISAASTEQSTGVGQISEAIAQMDQATQQNAALVEESAAAAESLRDQARQLVQVVAVFRLDGATSATSAASAAALPSLRRAEPPLARPVAVAKPQAVAARRPSLPARAATTASVSAAPVGAVPAGGDDWESF